MMNIWRIGILLFLSCLSVNQLHGQYLLGDFSLSENMESWYDDQVGLENTLLLNGKKFKFTRKSPNSHAFYEENSWQKMDLTYFGHTFRGVEALYNIEEDQFIIKNPNDELTPIQLTRSQVQSFDIGEDHFELINEQIGYRESGFYQILYRGKQVELICRVSKSLEIQTGKMTYAVDYLPYLKFGEKDYKHIIRFGGIKRMFPEHKKKLRKFKKSIGLRGRLDDKEKFDAFVRLVEYCDNLIVQ